MTKETVMVDVRGMQEWWHFQETGDPGPLLKVLEAGALAPVVQKMVANDQGLKQPGAYYLAIGKHGGKYGRAGRMFEVGRQISDWTEQFGKQDSALEEARAAGLITSLTQGKEAVALYREEMDRRARQDVEENE
jgi:hypothetical protein